MKLLKDFFGKVKNEEYTESSYDKNKCYQEYFNNELKGITDFAQTLCAVEVKKNELHPIFNVVKMISDSIIYENTLNLIKDEELERFHLEYLFVSREKNESIYNEICNCCKVLDLTNSVTIDLTEDAILPWVWNYNRLVRGLKTIGNEESEWTQDNNHKIRLITPIGVSFVESGNHSITTGVIKKRGGITIEKGFKCYATDISELYSLIYFDGENYRLMEDNQIIDKAQNINFGYLYEIGRIIKENEISFTAIRENK